MNTFPIGLIRLLYHSIMAVYYAAVGNEAKKEKHDKKIEELKKL
ncbi:MAG: hypothetical protein WDZ40_03310 [Candidatus Spechtbacterales bacterium]